MKFFFLVLLSASVSFAENKKPSIETQVARMTTYLNSFATLKQAFPAQIKSMSESGRTSLRNILLSIGDQKMPLHVNYGRQVRIYREDSTTLDVQIVSFEPLTFVIDNELKQYATYEDFLESLANLRKSTLIDLFLNKATAASASGGSPNLRILAGLAAYQYAEDVEGELLRNSPDQASFMKSLEMLERKNRGSKIKENSSASWEDAFSAKIAERHPQTTCNSSNEKLVPNATVSYSLVNEITKVKIQPEGSVGFLEFRKNAVTNESGFAFCESANAKCSEMDRSDLDYFTLRDKMTSDNKRAEIASIREAQFRLQKSRSLWEKSLRKVGSPGAANLKTPEDVRTVVLSDGNINELYELYLKKEKAVAQKDLNKNGNLLEKTSAHLKYALRDVLSKSSFKKAVESKLARHGLAAAVDDDYIRMDLAADSDIEENIFANVERLKPLRSSTNNIFLDLYPEYGVDKKKVEKEIEARSESLKNFRSAIAEADDLMHKLRKDKGSEDFHSPVCLERYKRSSERRARITTAYGFQNNDGAKTTETTDFERYDLAACNLRERYLRLTASAPDYSKIGANLMEVASCCLNNSCKGALMKKLAQTKKESKASSRDGIN